MFEVRRAVVDLEAGFVGQLRAHRRQGRHARADRGREEDDRVDGLRGREPNREQRALRMAQHTDPDVR
jgi:hypothetical protein